MDKSLCVYTHECTQTISSVEKSKSLTHLTHCCCIQETSQRTGLSNTFSKCTQNSCAIAQRMM